MDKQTFESFRSVVYEMSGITLGPQKEALVSARVGKRMRALQIPTHADYLEYVLKDQSGKEIVQLIDAISTNVTSFFREADHFDFLRNAIDKWRGAGQQRFRLWSAASSTGEEPYTIAMTMREAGSGCDVKILATDISTRVLEHCRRAEYTGERVESVPRALRARYFTAFKQGDASMYRVSDELKRLIVFRRLNLSAPPFPMKGPLDVVFCRNVMIYFDNQVRTRLLNEVYRLLKPGGYLMVGHAESLTGMVSEFKTVKPSIYIKK